jgi:hypothetical protein
MDKFKSMLKLKPNAQQQLRDYWQRKLRQECPDIERKIKGKCQTFHFFFSIMDFLQF